MKVRVLNVNEGHSQALMEQCQILKEYAQYVAMVRKYLAEMPLNDAVDQAVDECIRKGILTDFLRKNRAEVIKVSIFEYDKEIEEKKLREAEFEAGKEEGIQEGRQEGIRVGIIALLRLAEKVHLNETETIQQLCESMNLSVEEARKCYETYRNKNL